MAALDWQIRMFRQATALSIDCAIEIDADAREPAGHAADAVLGIFQEMLSNVARHASARGVIIRVALSSARLAIGLRDDGRGAPGAVFSDPTSRGVMGMRARAREFGASLSIDSAPGLGTGISLSVPLPPRAQMHRLEAGDVSV